MVRVHTVRYRKRRIARIQASLVALSPLAVKPVIRVRLWPPTRHGRTRISGHMTETDLYEQVAQYLRLKHPSAIFHFDLSGMWTPSHKARNLYGRLNQRAFPDLFLAQPQLSHAAYTANGCFVELKKEGTRLKKRDGSWASPHIEEQAAVLERLAQAGYIAQFATGLDEAVSIIDSYLSGVAA